MTEKIRLRSQASATSETVFWVGSCPYIYPWAFEFDVGKQSKKKLNENVNEQSQITQV